MFDDFHANTSADYGHKRFGSSMALAFVLYGGLSVAVIGATATVRRVAEEELTQVKFAAPPPPPPPAPIIEQPRTTPNPRPKVERKAIVTPKEVPKETPEESDKPLAPAGPAGPVDGFLDGVKGGTGTEPAPPPKPPPPVERVEPLIPPVALKGNRTPTYTPRARRLGLEGLVVVTFEITPDGSVSGVRIVSGPPELGEIVVKVVSGWRFQPATRGGKPVSFRKTLPVRFKLEEE
jgi:periplasmic protein TonB